ncbi:hypothetical protein B296_00015125 [Ensete ventricosum]|uniref:Uncharacterized protein n=1 Tax=Ensete ventricosum TaxID=4639 RepID=A0A426YTR3_ENSVE|nr:hypothetical protein B296_00015125 [Ensete ventricosum]
MTAARLSKHKTQTEMSCVCVSLRLSSQPSLVLSPSALHRSVSQRYFIAAPGLIMLLLSRFGPPHLVFGFPSFPVISRPRGFTAFVHLRWMIELRKQIHVELWGRGFRESSRTPRRTIGRVQWRTSA